MRKIKKIKELKEKDQFFTKAEVSTSCIEVTNRFYDIIKESLEVKKWVEPSAGNGDFYFSFPDYLDKQAFDIEKPPIINDDRYTEENFLDVIGLEVDTAYVGNPPFGKKGKLAFDFVVKTFELGASMVSFILPNSINTAVRKRIIEDMGYVLVYKEQLPSDSFYLDTGVKIIDSFVESFLQIYIRRDLVEKYNIKEHIDEVLRNDDYVQVYTINKNVVKNKHRDTKEKEFVQNGVGLDKIGKCDFYLPLRIFPTEETLRTYDDFDHEDMSSIGFGVISTDKDLKNKINVLNCYTLGTNKVYMSKKQHILKEINRVRNSQRR